MIHELYQDKLKRDARARDLRAQGYMLRRSTIHNQQLHPQYVTDYEGAAKHDTGFGNTVYKTFFAKLYALDVQQ